MNTYTKVNVTPYEYGLHTHIENIKNIKCPKLISYDTFKSTQVIKKINGLNVSDFYGENAKDVQITYLNGYKILLLLCIIII